MIGLKLGPYRILDKLGEGGMGEVYRARDTRLDRVVAIKVLSAALSTDAQLRERFEREARTISSLNHPNICVLHDVGRERPLAEGASAAPPSTDEGPVDFLVMEYLEGETLAARLARGPARSTRTASLSRLSATSSSTASGSSSTNEAPLPPMSVDEALRIAIPIARALDRAHRQGIVHRDLKPGNVMLIKGEGSEPGVKLLDFGLARLTRQVGSRASGGSSDSGIGGGLVSLADLATPTMSTPLTVKGTIVGTLQYMSPEQIEGKEIDARTDIFAFGVVLYEMLTGRRPFGGKSQASVIAGILDHDPPDVASLQPATPPLLNEIVRRALAKDPEDRWQSARDLMRQLEWVAAQSPQPAARTDDAPVTTRPSTRLQLVGLGAALLTGAAVAAGVASWVLWPQPPAPAPVTRSAFVLPDGQVFTRPGRHLMSISADGTRLVYVANEQLYLRHMNELGSTPIVGTEKLDPTEPVFSPDGAWIAFWSANQLRKVPVTGGTPVTLSAAQNPFGMTWMGDRILFGQNDPKGHRGIVEVPASGGTPTLLVALEPQDGSAHGPQLVGDGRAVVFALRTGNTMWDEATIVAHELATGKRTVLVERGTDPQVLPTGHLVFARATSLFAVPFDAARLTVTGGPVPVQDGIQGAAGNATGAVHASWSASGTLVFSPGNAAALDNILVWMDRQGKQEPATAPPRNYSTRPTDLRISPDGTRVAVVINPGLVNALASGGLTRAGQAIQGDDIWVWDIARTTLTRVTFTGQAGFPLWTPDSRRVCYAVGAAVQCQSADGSGQPQVLLKVEGPEYDLDPALTVVGLRGFSPDATRVLIGARLVKTKSLDIFLTILGPSPTTNPLIATPYAESAAMISPDGRWLAYQSDESGNNEIYIRPFPEVDSGRWQISTAGGAEPRWAATSRELYFTTGGGAAGTRHVWAVSLEPGSRLVPSAPKRLLTFPAPTHAGYDVAPDGRFLFAVDPNTRQDPTDQGQQLVIVQNWFADLRARVPIPD